MQALLRDEAFRSVIDDLLAIPPVEGAIILTRRGRVLAARMPEWADPRAVARECRYMLEAASGTIPSSGDLVRVDLRGTKGSTVVLRAGQHTILAVLTRTRTPESLSLEISRAASRLAETVR